MALHGGLVASFDIEPFTKYGEHATESAYPHHASPLPVRLFAPRFPKFSILLTSTFCYCY